MATCISVRCSAMLRLPGCRKIVVRTLYAHLQRRGQPSLPPPCLPLRSQRLLTLSAAHLDKTTTSKSSGELFEPTDVLQDMSSGVESSIDTVITQAAGDSSTVAPEVVDLSSLGLGGYWPSGLIQSTLELIHNHTHLPWWACIVGLTVTLRLAMFPLVVKMQQVGAKIANINKEVRPYHAKIMECKARGDKIGESQAGIEILKIYQQHKVHPLQMFPLAFAQVPVFLSVLYGLRGMAGLPLESFRTGGMLWFTDLVVPDPTFCLPLMACGSFLINIELGGEGGATTDNELSNRLRWFMRVGSFLILPITTTFPSAVLVYWVSNSMFSTVQILFFKLHSVKKLFGIPKLIKNK